MIDMRYGFSDYIEEGQVAISSKAEIIRVRFVRGLVELVGVIKKFSEVKQCHIQEGEYAVKASQLDVAFVKCYDHFQTADNQYCIVMELCSKGSVKSDIISRRRGRQSWTETEFIAIMCMLFEGMQKLHENQMTHCDLKPDNLFITEDGLVKIGDFGSSKMFKHRREIGTLRGTVDYLPPELYVAYIQRQNFLEIDFISADVWSLGRTLFEMAGLKTLKGLSITDQDALNTTLREYWTKRTSYSDLLCSLLVKMHCIDPDGRPQFKDLVRELRLIKMLSAPVDFSYRNLDLFNQDIGDIKEPEQPRPQSASPKEYPAHCNGVYRLTEQKEIEHREPILKKRERIEQGERADLYDFGDATIDFLL
jgi:serine/threonine protein kinase